jgi:hypothetical protein
MRCIYSFSIYKNDITEHKSYPDRVRINPSNESEPPSVLKLLQAVAIYCTILPVFI